MIEATNQDLGGHLVLVVDDDFRVRSYVRTVLEGANIQVLEAGDGVEALKMFRVWRDKLDLVITDVRMPHMSGTELASSLQLSRPGIPLIFLSGEPAVPNTSDSIEGFVFIVKPFDPKALLAAARRCLS